MENNEMQNSTDKLKNWMQNKRNQFISHLNRETLWVDGIFYYVWRQDHIQKFSISKIRNKRLDWFLYDNKSRETTLI